MLELRIQLARKHRRANDIGPESDRTAVEFALQESMVEACVVGDEQPAVQTACNIVGDLAEARRIGEHLVGDAGVRARDPRYTTAGMDQARSFLRVAVVDRHDTDFDDAVGTRA